MLRPALWTGAFFPVDHVVRRAARSLALGQAKNAKRPACCFLTFLLLCGQVHADTVHGSIDRAPVHWEFAGWYGGGAYPNIAFDPNVRGRVYLTSDVAGLWRSDDLGEAWTFINEGLSDLSVAWVESSPSDPDIVYAGTRKGVFRSLNAGGSWRPCGDAPAPLSFLRPQSYKSAAISSSDPGSLAVGTADGYVLLSSDGCNSWQSLGRPQKNPITYAGWAAGSETLFVAGAAGFDSYSSKKRAWSERAAGGPAGITDVQVMPSGRVFAASGGLLAVADSLGARWTLKDVPKKIFRILATESSGEVRVWGAWNENWQGGLLLSRNGGRDWSEESAELTPATSLDPTRQWAGLKGRTNALKGDPFNSQVMFRTDFWGVWRSDDGGAAWSEKIKGAPNTVYSDIVVTEDDRIYTGAMDAGLLRSSDGGKTYEPVFPLYGYDKRVSGHAWRVLELKDKKLIATSSPWNDDANQTVIINERDESTDFVRTGLPVKKPVKNTMWESGFPRALALDALEPSTLYLGIDGDDGGGLFVSHDSGVSWKRSAGQPGSRRIYNALAVDPSQRGRLYWGAFGKKGGVYVSPDGGRTWKRTLRTMRKVFDIAADSSGRVYVAGEMSHAALYVSEDHGESWKMLKLFPEKGTCEALTLDTRHPGRIALSTVRWDGVAEDALYLSEDYGLIWTRIDGDLPHGRGAAAMAFGASGDLYMARYAGGIYKTRITEPVKRGTGPAS